MTILKLLSDSKTPLKNHALLPIDLSEAFVGWSRRYRHGLASYFGTGVNGELLAQVVGRLVELLPGNHLAIWLEGADVSKQQVLVLDRDAVGDALVCLLGMSLVVVAQSLSSKLSIDFTYNPESGELEILPLDKLLAPVEDVLRTVKDVSWYFESRDKDTPPRLVAP